jgi:hypothetical protein
LAVSHDTPQYLFLMRHAQHHQGHLTEEGSAHVGSLAMRFSEWVRAEWRNQPGRTIRDGYLVATDGGLDEGDIQVPALLGLDPSHLGFIRHAGCRRQGHLHVRPGTRRAGRSDGDVVEPDSSAGASCAGPS